MSSGRNFEGSPHYLESHVPNNTVDSPRRGPTDDVERERQGPDERRDSLSSVIPILVPEPQTETP